MIEAKSVRLEDGIEYMVIDEIDNATTTYYYLAIIDDEEDFCIRKIEKENDDQLLVGLDSDQEFDRAMLMFMKKNKGYFG